MPESFYEIVKKAWNCTIGGSILPPDSIDQRKASLATALQLAGGVEFH
jgi:hypothetical protein